MSEKKSGLKKELSIKSTNDVVSLVERKIEFFKDVIQNTIIHVQKNKVLDILGISDTNNCIEKLGSLCKKIEDMVDNQITDKDHVVNNLQFINNELSSLLRNYGTHSFDDLLTICFGNNNKVSICEKDTYKLELLKKYFHPTSYRVCNKKDVILDETKNHIVCSDISSNVKQFHLQVYGLKVQVYSEQLNKSLIIFGMMDDVVIDFLGNKTIKNRVNTLIEDKPNDPSFDGDCFQKYISSLMLKDFLISEENVDIYNKFAGLLSHNAVVRQKPINYAVKEFIANDMYTKRLTLISLLVKSSSYENQYLAYLLYDLLSNESNGNVDTQEQTILFDSFSWSMKQLFKQAMKKTIQYTNELSNFDINKVPLEQQICLMKAPDNVKEKAMLKLKEVKAKSEDTGAKARQYLDGLLKIPFGIYKREEILDNMEQVRIQFKEMYMKYDLPKIIPEIPTREKYTSVETFKYLNILRKMDSTCSLNELATSITSSCDKKTLLSNVATINNILSSHKKKINKCSQMSKDDIISYITAQFNKYEDDEAISGELIGAFNQNSSTSSSSALKEDIQQIDNKMVKINGYMKDVKKTLDAAVYGHNNAKKQIERIIGQWINGDVNNMSHVLGFEGNPGIGKTTLAKGLANCLKDENGVSRPFSLIALGGDSNSSTLLGHSYTYVGSTYGQLVQILIDSKCMNPIILFDEVDKISKTEQGREITGVLTHLLDSTQNSIFQDKYFAGIDLDLSKALFILSYNDVNSIDPILLDRVHRIKFDSLSIEDKIVISNNHLLPEIYKKIGLENMIHFSDEVLKFIIEEYTLEPGVRKLKEKYFEIIGDINLNILSDITADYELPINVTIDDIKTKYFKDKREVKVYKIHDESRVGVINALWANSMSQGGVLPLQASFVPASRFLELTLTGSMGDVMKESIQVSLTNAWNLTSPERQKYLIEKYNDPKNNNVQGIHIHCPDISTPKDGPSATTAFSILLTSLFSDIKIKNYVGLTGETHFGYLMTEIGGLQEKIIHSIKSGITEFIFPKENQQDFDKIMKKYKDNDIIKGIKFHAVSHVTEAMDIILEK